ncbi:hypothetical protein [Flavobacterium silvaticum]|uniref:Uncharacterized protein n=1 Tax=Flavobacterium silvaticum TaxID=1852020 RepID=A0A972FJX8_9FLAO|nr:hypothetical protein [Flavobacterium silvaticum]NMH27138.1 hypothetical protein [Flavobacterium silvaticum]
MKNMLFLLALLPLLSAAQTVSCSDYKTGEFVYPNNANKVSLRKETTQESYNDGKLEAVWNVKWLSDCKYELVCTKRLKDDSPFQLGDKMVATILETDDSCYTFSLTVFNSLHPEGFEVPNGKMCRK